MKITAIEIENIRCFENIEKLSLSDSINIFIGPNNSGKSTILKIIYSIQRDTLDTTDVTLRKHFSHAKLYLKHEEQDATSDVKGYDIIEVLPKKQGKLKAVRVIESNGVKNIEDKELNKVASMYPQNVVVPYLSKRKVTNFSSDINQQAINTVTGDFTYLNAKIDQLNDDELEEYSYYRDACIDILGFKVSTYALQQGKHAGYIISTADKIPLDAMGEGVPNILGLIAELCLAKNKIFLIEEPENDIHPHSLKKLLKLIIDKSTDNQFFISTHSNIVMKYLGAAANTKMFNIKNDIASNSVNKLKLSSITEIGNDPQERLQVLQDLGYDFYDFDLWEAWLFLEESSAEVIISKLIHWFVPNMVGRLRTFSAGGTSKVADKFEDFNKLFVFLHLQEIYKNKVWVKLDSGDNEEKIISEMKSLYTSKGWYDNNFSQFKEHDFEKYYPNQFNQAVEKVLGLNDRQTKRKAKKELLDSVKAWIKNDEELAKNEFAKSAKEVIEFLQTIDLRL